MNIQVKSERINKYISDENVFVSLFRNNEKRE